MKQTMSSKKSPLLAYAFSRLRPEIFSHPVWRRFGRNGIYASPDIIDDLLSAAKNLQRDDPSSACQVLLICAVYQNYTGRRQHALRTTQQALTLAQQTGLSRETLWAIWAICAISIQQGNYDQAADQFVELQAALGEQSEWMLADFIDELKQSLSQSSTLPGREQSGWLRDRPLGDLLVLTFDWLHNWGFSAQESASEPMIIPADSTRRTSKQSTVTGSLFSMQRLQGRWHTLMLAIRGELEVHWQEHDEYQTKKNRGGSFWGSLLGWLRLYLSGRNLDTVFKESPSPKPVRPVAQIEQNSRNQPAEQASTITPLAVHMLGSFSMSVGDLTVKLRASRGLSVLKYILYHHKQNTPREVLMDVFWPDAEPETARNNLNVAIHSLRRALRTVVFLPVIVFEDGAYGLESNLKVWLDVEEFERCVRAGQRLESRSQLTAAVNEYEAAKSLYQGDFLEQNPYEEWTILDRERLRIAYLDTLDRLSQIYFSQERYAACITVCQLILTRDRCREDAHGLLMRCYSRQGQYQLALRQYQICIEALRTELQVGPAPETQKLYERIRRRELI